MCNFSWDGKNSSYELGCECCWQPLSVYKRVGKMSRVFFSWILASSIRTSCRFFLRPKSAFEVGRMSGICPETWDFTVVRVKPEPMIFGYFLGVDFFHEGWNLNLNLGGGFWNMFFIFTPKIGEDEAILTMIYFSKGLVKNHQLAYFHLFLGGQWGKFPWNIAVSIQLI